MYASEPLLLAAPLPFSPAPLHTSSLAPAPARAGCCGARRDIIPLLGALAAARAALAAAAAAALGLSLFFLFSGGWAFVSTVLVIAQACVLRRAARSADALSALALEDRADAATPARARACCAPRRTAAARGLATAAIAFAALEAGVGLGVGFGLGAEVGRPAGAAQLTGPVAAKYLRVCGTLADGGGPACLVGVDSLSYGGSEDAGDGGGPRHWSAAVGIHFGANVGASQYLFYAAGATLFPAAGNIALSVLTLTATNIVAGVVDAPYP